MLALHPRVWILAALVVAFAPALASAQATPTNQFPLNGATRISPSPTLEINCPTVGLSAAQYQISTGSSFGTLAYDSGENVNDLCSHVAAVDLSSLTQYFWRARVKSSQGVWSAFSTPTSFTTVDAATVFTNVFQDGMLAYAGTRDADIRGRYLQPSLPPVREWNQGRQNVLRTGRSPVGSFDDETYRSLLRFILSPHLTDPAAVVTAYIELTGWEHSDATLFSAPQALYELRRAWGEGQGVASTAPGPGEVSWTYAAYPTGWAIRGAGLASDTDPNADRASTPLVRLVATNQVGHVTRWSSNAFIEAVKRWIGQPTSNRGVLIQAEDESLQHVLNLAAREHPDPDSRPTLVIESTQRAVWPPAARDDLAGTVDGMPVDIDVLANDVDPEPGPSSLTIASVGTPSNGIATVSSGVISYTPNGGFVGVDEFPYTISDGALTGIGTVKVSVGSTVVGVLFGIEAERGELVLPMTTKDDVDASAGQYISVANGVGNLPDPAQPGGQATYKFSVPAGTYAIWGRGLAPTGNDDSFWVSIDGGQFIQWTIPVGADWNWSRIGTAFTLAAGGHTLVVKHREDGAQVDRLIFTSNLNFVPQGVTGDGATIWSPSDIPAVTAESDNGSVELGVKFQSDVAGVITGIRFYKGLGNDGTHVGSLWSSTGQLLASVTFTGESAGGWQQASFATPVSIAANTIYVASYHAPLGHYAVNKPYFTSGIDNPPLHAVATGVSPNGVYAYAAASVFPTNTFQSSNYWVDVVFIPASGPDTTPPTVTSVSPAAGATGVSATTAVTATFSEAMTASTINTTTFELRDPSNTLVPASVTYNSTTNVATLTPTSALAANTTYTATVRGGTTDPRVKDLANNAMVSNFTWSFTTVGVATCPCTIWSPTTTPAVSAEADNGAVNLGVKFRSDVAGTITGIRFYKGVGNGGTHVGSLWTSTGQLLGSVTFGGESASGWQQANFATPVSIAANTIYVASYHAPLGHYAVNKPFFASGGVDNAPLHAVSSAVSANGVYAYAATSTFPTNTFQSSNYWVDVVFMPTSGGPDTTPPTVTGVTPASGATGVSATTTVTATFSEAMTASTINTTTFELRNPSNNLVPASVTYSTTTNVATLTPTNALAAGTTYTATVRGGAADPRVKDLAGNALAANFTWSFTTAGVPSCPCSIWSPSNTPAINNEADNTAVNLGVKFRSDVAGVITGIRFYKGSGNGGTHVGSLWTSTGQLLGSVTFSGETASGWQQANFATPIAISANTIYVASYHAPLGHYSINRPYFATGGADNPPLHAVASGVSLNGVYVYAPAPAFPTNSYQDSNYWVDVVFTPSP